MATTEITLKEDAQSAFSDAKSLTIKDTKSMTEGTDLLSYLNKKLDAVTIEKEKVTKPLNEALKAERGRWKPIETILEEAIGSLRRKMSVYQTEQIRKQKEEEAKIAARIGEGKGKLKVETAVRQMEEIDRPDAKIQTDRGSVSFRTDKILKIVDATKIPRNFLLPDEKLILMHLKNGNVVPGCEIEEVQTPINSRK